MVGLEGPKQEGPDEVCKQMIRHWCEAMEDANPLYTQEEYARKSKYGSIIAPPPMAQAFVNAPLWPDGQSERLRPTKPRPPGELRDPRDVLADIVIKQGYTGVALSQSTSEFLRPVFPGDRLSMVRKFVAISPSKTTRLGTGYFFTFKRPISNQTGEMVVRQTEVVFRFKPASR